MADAMQLIVGLGNPGPQYAATRHNVGQVCAQKIADKFTATLKTEAKFKGMVAQLTHDNHKLWLLLPTTYMNNSGESVSAFAKFYKIPPQSILIIHDELDFSPGDIRLKFDGGHGGHNGLRSITQHLNSNQFYRLRIGIGHPGDRDAVVDYVLHSPSTADKISILQAIDRGLDILPDLITGDIEKAMQTLHTQS